MLKIKNHGVFYKVLFLVFCSIMIVYIFNYKDILDIIYILVMGAFSLKLTFNMNK